MIYSNVINLINKLNIHYEIYADSAERLKWGTKYYSYSNYNNEIVYYFPYSPLQIHSVLLRPSDDVYPVYWTLSVSRDNTTFHTIINNGTKPCRDSNVIHFQQKSYTCESYEPLTFDATIVDYFSYFVKFKLIENSYYEAETSIYKNVICTYGIDFVANFPTWFKVTFSDNSHHNPISISAFAIFLLNK